MTSSSTGRVPRPRRRRRVGGRATSRAPPPRPPRRGRAPRRARRPRATRSPRLRRQTTPTAWSIVSLFTRRPAPRWSAATPTADRVEVRRPCPPAGRRPRERPVRARAPSVGRAALGLDPAVPDRLGGAVRDGGLGAGAALGDVDPEVGEREQPRAGVEHELGEVRRPLAAHRVERLAHLERVADRGAERLVHVGEQADDLASGVAGRARASLSARRRASSSVFMKAPLPTLTSSTIACAPAASFFDMIEAAISESWSTVAVTSRSA